MNEWNELLLQAVKKAGGMVEGGIELVWAEAPEIVRQLLMWKMAEASIFLLLGIILAVVTFFGVKFCIKKCEEVGSYDEAPYQMGIIFGGLIGSLISTTTIIVNTLIIVQISIAPKIYLMEYVAKLMKGN